MRAGAWKIEECGDGGREAYQVEMMIWMDIYLRLVQVLMFATTWDGYTDGYSKG